MNAKFFTIAAALAAMIMSVAAVQAQTAEQDPINAMCPIGKEPIVPSAGTIEYKGHTIGLCCPGCGKAFLAWEESRRDEFVALAMRGAEPGHDHQSEAAEPAAESSSAGSHPYPLDICIVSGQKLGSMGEPVVKQYDGREVKFCCQACVGKFEAEQDEYVKQIDEKIVEQQLLHYPIDTCIVAGGKLGSMGDPVNLVYNNRLVRFCCAGCLPKFKADPAKYFKALDKQLVEQQIKTYPLSTCVVAGGELGSMGDPVDYIFGNRLVRFCCASCIKKFEASPGTYMGKIDKAYADAQRAAYPLNTCVVAGGVLGSMGDPVEIVAGNQLVRFCCAGCLPKFEADPAKYLAAIDTAKSSSK